MTLAHRLRPLWTLAAPAALAAAIILAPAPVLADQPDAKAEAAKPADGVKPADTPKPAEAQPAAAADAAKDAPKEGAKEKEDVAPAPRTAKVSPEAQQVIEQVDAAYAKLKSLELAGTYSADISAAGGEKKETKKFTASFVAPNKFRHEMEEDMMLVANGEKAFAFDQSRNRYGYGEAPRERAELARLPEPFPQILQTQNPSLMFAVVRSVSAELKELFVDIARAEDVRLGDTAFPALRATLPDNRVVTMLFDPATHLLRQVRYDVRARLEQRGTPDVKQAMLTVDYTTVKADAKVLEEQFAWAPPQTARDIAEVAQAQAGAAGAGGSDSPSKQLEGKAAPEFKLKKMDGTEVALSGLKGKVVVLDIWATWCPPCRASLPHLDKLHASVKDKGVSVFAVNLQEDKEDVEQFIKSTNLKTPVLLDADGAVALAYKAAAIPQTVVIGKDGQVAKVIVGFMGEETAKELKDVVEKAMK